MKNIWKFRMAMMDFNEEENYKNWIPYNTYISKEKYHELQEHKFFNAWKWDLKPGDKVKNSIELEGEDPFKEIETIIYDNDYDHRNIDGGLSRVSINGLHWNIDDIKEALVDNKIKKEWTKEI